MHQIYPHIRDDVDPAEAYDDPRRQQARDRPYVFLNMVASIDGATVVDGVSGALGGTGDREIFLLLRSMADAIMAGAQTVRAESYGPPKVREEHQQGRQARGQAPLPRLAVVSRSLSFDWSSPLFTEAVDRPFVLTPAGGDAARLDAASRHADVIAVGDPELDMPAALRELRSAGVASLLCEGGPTINGVLLEQGLVDELCLTVSPALVGRTGGTSIVGAPALEALVPLELAHVLTDEGYLFLRYLVRR